MKIAASFYKKAGVGRLPAYSAAAFVLTREHIETLYRRVQYTDSAIVNVHIYKARENDSTGYGELIIRDQQHYENHEHT